MLSLATRIKEIKPSATMAVDAKAKAMRDKGIDIIGFGVGEPDFDTPQNIKEAGIKAIKDGVTKYTLVGGTDEIKDAIIEKLKIENNLKYDRSEIIVSCGAKHSLYNISMALFERGDEVIIPVPYWVTYPPQVVIAESSPAFLETSEKNDFKFSAEELESLVTSKTKALILNSPSNPTGSAYRIEELQEIAEVAIMKKFYIISDEIYEKLVYDGYKHISIASLGDDIKRQTILVNGVSKTYSMTGWRIGYAAGPKEIISAMNNIQGQSTSNPTSIAQKASVEALKGSQDSIILMLKEFDERRKYMLNRLISIKGIKCTKPSGAFYLFPNVSYYYGKQYHGKTINGSSDFAEFLLEEARVAVVPGIAFGNDAYVRLSYATSMENIEKGMDRIEEVLKKFTLYK